MLRSATPDDVPAIHGLVVELAEYERARHEVELDADALHAVLFGADPVGRCEVVEVGGTVVGLALWFRQVSTWTGVGLYLEDLYVRPEHRGRGWGTALLQRLAGICVEHGWARFEWSVLDWNEPAIGFYRSIGAVAQTEWVRERLSGEALSALAAR